MKTKVSLLLIACILFALNGCFPMKTIKGDGNVVTKTIDVSDYEKIEAGSDMIITYAQTSDSPFLEVRTDQNIFDTFEFVIEDGNKLVIRPKKGFRHNTNFRPTEFVINGRSTLLKAVSIAGSTAFTVTSPLTSDELELKLAGSGSIVLQDTVRADRITTKMAGSASIAMNYIICSHYNGEVAGSGKIALAGTAEDALYEIAGSGEVRAFDFVTVNTKAKIAGSGELDVHATNSLNVSGAGSAKINYKGHPQQVNNKIAGSAKVEHIH